MRNWSTLPTLTQKKRACSKQTLVHLAIFCLLAHLCFSDNSCPPIQPANGYEVGYNVTIDPWAKAVYIERKDNSSGYWVISEPTWNFSRMHYAMRFSGDVAEAHLGYLDGASTLGFASKTGIVVVNSYYVRNVNQNLTSLFGFNALAHGVYSYQVYFRPEGQACAGYGYLDGTHLIDICANPSYIPPNAVCKKYECFPCDCACRFCFGPARTTCTACKSGYFLQPAPNSTQCLDSCPAGYYPNRNASICKPCDSSCLTCSGAGPNACVSCHFGLYLQPNIPSCADTCPFGYWPNPSTGKCSPCNLACNGCTGPLNTQCFTCASGFFLQTLSTQQMCTSYCPEGLYQDPISGKCNPCNPSCIGCTGPGNKQCVQCSTGYYKATSLTTSESSCVTTCPDGYWPDNSQNTCSQCDSTCESCTGPESTSCLTCKSGLYFQPATRLCLSSCPTGYWLNTVSQECSPCMLECASCSSSSSCLTCSSGYFVQPNSNECADSCPRGYYQNATSNKCLSCHESCETCTGPTNNECTDCKQGFFLQPSSTTCLKTCPVLGYWADVQNNICSACDLSCETCKSLSDGCSTCKKDFFLQPHTNACEADCPPGFYQDDQGNTCKQCNSSCYICDGPTDTQCYSCSKGYFLQPASTICMSSCPEIEYWENPLDNTCTLYTTFDEWSFWTALVYIIWLVFTLLMIKTTSLEEYCLVEPLRQQSKDIRPTILYKIVLSVEVSHPLVSIYLYNDPEITKVTRTFFYFIRSMILFSFSAIMMGSDPVRSLKLTH